MRFRRALCVSVCVAAVAACENIVTFEGDLETVAPTVRSDATPPSLGFGTAQTPSRNANLLTFALSAVENSPETASARYLRDAAEAQVKEDVARFRPQGSLTIEQIYTDQEILESSNPSFAGNKSSFETLEATLRFEQTIIDVPAVAEIARSRAELEARTADVLRTQQDVLSTVLTRFLDSSEALERVKLARAEVRYFQQLNAAEQRRVNEGDLRASERGATVSELARARSDLAIAQADYDIRVGALCRMAPAAACPQPGAISLSRALPRPAPLSAEERNAIASGPEIAVLDAGLKSALREVDRARTGTYPTLSAYIEGARRDRGGSLFDGSSLTETVNTGIVLDWQFLQGGRVRAASERELNEAYALSAQREGQVRARMGELEAAVDGLDALWRNDIALATVQNARARALGASRSELNAGTGTDVDVSRAQLEVVRASVLRSTTRRTYLSAMVARHHATGRLDQEMVDLIRKFANNF